jgi:D-glycero-alpha-D-manno-heptose-7-phosphate kinase
MSFLGGGTDYPSWYQREAGAVLSTSIDKYCYISCRVLPPFFDMKHRIVWSHIETVSTISEILHPAVRAGLRHMGFTDSVGIELHHQGDLPARAGMGSSSAFVVGMVAALKSLRGESFEPRELAEQAIELEQNVLKENVGSQDQIACAYGGFNRIDFMSDGDFRVSPVSAPPGRLDALASRLLLIYTGRTRLATEIAGSVVDGLLQRPELLRQMRDSVDDGCRILEGTGDLDEFGALLHEAWMRKREISAVISNEQIDEIYERALENGALGGKLLGAGSTGFMVFYIPDGARSAVERALRAFVQVPVRFSSHGCELLSSKFETEESWDAASAGGKPAN